MGNKVLIFLDEDLNDRDMTAYRKLVNFVDSFKPGTCTLSKVDQLYEENDYPLLAARRINTKAILECETEGKP